MKYRVQAFGGYSVKIMFVIPSLRGGGAERVAVTLCNHWAEIGHDVMLHTFDSPENDFYKASASIKRSYCGYYEVFGANIFFKIFFILKKCFAINKAYKNFKPDSVISFCDYCNIITVIALLLSNTKVIISERTYPPYYNENNFFDIIRKIIYKFADMLVCQSMDVRLWALGFLAGKKTVIIPNPIAENFNGNANLDEKTIVAVGRLCDEKGFDMLIDAFLLVSYEAVNWKLVIVGDGEKKAELQRQIDDLGLSNAISLVGRADPIQYLLNSSIFAMSSRVEGFPNAMLEAMKCGLPIVSLNCKAGPADIIKHGENGFLADDVQDLAAALLALINNSDLRKRMAKKSKVLSNQYNLSNISDKWLKLCKDGCV